MAMRVMECDFRLRFLPPGSRVARAGRRARILLYETREILDVSTGVSGKMPWPRLKMAGASGG